MREFKPKSSKKRLDQAKNLNNVPNQQQPAPKITSNEDLKYDSIDELLGT